MKRRRDRGRGAPPGWADLWFVAGIPGDPGCSRHAGRAGRILGYRHVRGIDAVLVHFPAGDYRLFSPHALLNVTTNLSTPSTFRALHVAAIEWARRDAGQSERRGRILSEQEAPMAKASQKSAKKLNAEQAAQFLGVSPTSVKRYAREGKLIAERIGEGVRATWLFAKSDLKKFKLPAPGRPRSASNGDAAARDRR